MAGNTVRIRATLDDKVSSGLDRIRDRFDRLGKSKGAASILQGVGVGVGISAYGMLDRAISGVINVMGDATRAAMEEEASVARLGAALNANIPAWNGNTDAIESVLASRIKLGFADDEQRESLARLVVATKDETKALAIQRAAMDLARLKQIDLGTATDALIKVEGGQFRALKALGIELKKGATATDALAAVQKAAAGQAEAYAQTNEGKLLTSQVRVGEAMEKLGEKTMPLVADSMVAAADAVEGLSLVFDALNGKVPTTNESIVAAEDAVIHYVDALALLNPLFGTVAAGMRDVRTESDNLAGKAEDDALSITSSFDTIGSSSGEMAADVKVNNLTAAESFDLITDAIDKLIDDAFDPLSAKYDLIATNAEVSANRRAVATKGATLEEKTALNDSLKKQAEGVLAMAKTGQQGSQVYKDAIASLKRSAREATGPTKAYLLDVIKSIQNIKTIGKSVPINLVATTSLKGGYLGGARAGGGPVAADTAYVVGEEGPELFVPGSSGNIIPNGGGGRAAGGGLTINFNSLWPPTREQAKDVARLIDEATYSSAQFAVPTSGRV